MAAAKKTEKVTLAGVDDYPERPLEDALVDPEEIAVLEDRPSEDQIKDYHKDNPTLKPDAGNDPEVQADLQDKQTEQDQQADQKNEDDK